MRIIAVILISILGLKECDDSKNSENVFKREERIIAEYEKKVVISKGKETYYIPKNEIHWYFDANSFLSLEEAQVNDNISFFDKDGNIVYQGLLIEFRNGKPYIKCQDLTTANYYVTMLTSDSIRDLIRGYEYEIKAYRHR